MIEQLVRDVTRLYFIALILLLDDVLLDTFVDQVISIFAPFRLIIDHAWSSVMVAIYLFALSSVILCLANRTPILHRSHH